VRTTRSSPLRTNSLQAGLVVWALVVIVRLFWLQMVDHSWLEQRAEHQQEETVTVAAQRGVIYDRNLTPLAMSLPVESLFALPRQIADPDAAAAELGEALGESPATIRPLLERKRSFVWVARQVRAEPAAAVRALHLKGVYFQPDSRRFYPKGELAANVLGYVGVDGTGLGGIEHSFDRAIRGSDGKATLEVELSSDRASGGAGREPDSDD
jgi:cell division protein FtsI/penicillin-binding protein 2